MTPPNPETPPITALVRAPGPEFVRALSKHPHRHRIDWRRARRQHERYVEALQSAGAHIETLPPLKDCPDAPFIEDTALIFPERALICTLKETSRQDETASVAQALKPYRKLTYLAAPATLDGGDVLDTEDTLYVGQSSRTGVHCVDTLEQVSGKPVVTVGVHQGLHLKSSVSYLGSNRLLLAPSRVETQPLESFDWIEVQEEEAYGANCLTVGKTVLMAAGFSRLAKRIEALNYDVVELEMSEFEKADGAITCLSLLIPPQASG